MTILLCKELDLNPCRACKHCSTESPPRCDVEWYRYLINKNNSKNEVKRLFDIAVACDRTFDKEKSVYYLINTIYAFHSQYTSFINILLVLK